MKKLRSRIRVEALDAVLGHAGGRGGVVLLGLLAHVVSLGSFSCRSRIRGRRRLVVLDLDDGRAEDVHLDDEVGVVRAAAAVALDLAVRVLDRDADDAVGVQRVGLAR